MIHDEEAVKWYNSANDQFAVCSGVRSRWGRAVICPMTPQEETGLLLLSSLPGMPMLLFQIELLL